MSTPNEVLLNKITILQVETLMYLIFHLKQQHPSRNTVNIINLHYSGLWFICRHFITVDIMLVNHNKVDILWTDAAKVTALWTTLVYHPWTPPTSSGDVVRRFLLRRNENLSSRLQDDVLMCFVRKKQYVASGEVGCWGLSGKVWKQISQFMEQNQIKHLKLFFNLFAAVLFVGKRSKNGFAF